MGFWVALLLPGIMLVIASVMTRRQSSKLGALAALGALLLLYWFAVLGALGDLSAHTSVAGFPPPIALGGMLAGFYVLTACLSLFRGGIIKRGAK